MSSWWRKHWIVKMEASLHHCWQHIPQRQLDFLVRAILKGQTWPGHMWGLASQQALEFSSRLSWERAHSTKLTTPPPRWASLELLVETPCCIFTHSTISGVSANAAEKKSHTALTITPPSAAAAGILETLCRARHSENLKQPLEQQRSPAEFIRSELCLKSMACSCTKQPHTAKEEYFSLHSRNGWIQRFGLELENN